MRRPCLTWLFLLALTPLARAGSHSWKVNELFSNASGTVQFIELWECCGNSGELGMANIPVTSETNGTIFSFPDHITGDTANAYMLLATQGFANLPGAPTPDYIIPDNFFSLGADVVWYNPVSGYDSFTYGDNDMPTDGANAIHVTDWALDQFTTGPNSPTNYAGETGTVDATAAIPAADPMSLLVTLAILSAAAVFIRPSRRKA